MIASLAMHLPTDTHAFADGIKHLSSRFGLRSLVFLALAMALVMPLFFAIWNVQDIKLGMDAPPALRLTNAQSLRICDGHIGFEPNPKSVRSTDLKGTWQPTDLGQWQGQGLYSGDKTGADKFATCTTWIRLTVPVGLNTSDALWLFATRIYSGGPIGIYADGEEIYGAQPRGMTWAAAYQPLWTPAQTMTGDAPHEILIRLTSYQSTLPHLAPLWIGSENSLYWRQNMYVVLTSAVPSYFCVAFFVVGVYLFMAWWQRLRLRFMFWYFVLATSAVTVYFVEHFFDPVFASDWYGWFRNSFNVTWFIATHFMLKTLHGKRNRLLDRILIALFGFNFLANLPFISGSSFMPLINPVSLLTPLLVVPIVLGYGLYCGWRRSRWVFALCLLDSLVVLEVLAIQLQLLGPETIDFTGYVNLSKFLLVFLLLYRSYMAALKKEAAARASLKTALARREAELELSYARLREVERRNTLTQERERLMQDMHDGMGSSLHGALRAIETGQISNAGVAEVLKACIDDLRLAIDSMEPIQADLPLLLATLRFRLGSRLQAQGITLRWAVQSVQPLEWLDPRCSLHIMRIIQEAFTNIIKHTKATTITVTTSERADCVGVCIVDNGGGFDWECAQSKGGKGLHNQLRRAQSIGAHIDWSAVEDGTSMTIWLPLQRAFDNQLHPNDALDSLPPLAHSSALAA